MRRQNMFFARPILANATLAGFALALAILPQVSQVSRAADDDQTIEIAELSRDTPVDFEKEILPLFKRSCLACHNATVAESRLVLESPATILAGGDSGPAAIAKNSAESLILSRASGQVDSIMPPRDNKVAAPRLTPEELGLIKLWIEQGAGGEVGGADRIEWQPLPPGVNPIYAVAVTPDGQYAACGRANQIFIYHLPTGRLICRLTDPELLKSGIYQQPGVADLDLIQSLAFSPDGSVLASGGYRTIKLWKRPRDMRVATLDAALADGVLAISASPDGKWLATASADFTIKIWDTSTSQSVATLAGHAAAVTALRFSADNMHLVSASLDKSIRRWQIPTGTLAGRIDTPGPIQSLAIVGDGSQLASGGADNLIRVWKTPMSPAAALAGPAAPIAAAVTSADGKLAAIATADGGITLLDLAGGGPPRALPGHPGGVTSLAFQRDNSRLASSGADMIVRIWDVAQGTPLAQSEPIAAATSLALNPAGNQVVSGASDGAVIVWKLDGGSLTQERRLEGHTQRVSGLAFNADGSLVYTASADGTLRAFQTADGQQRFAAAPGVALNDVAASPDGRWLAVAADNNLIHVFNAADGSPAAKPQLAGFTGPVRKIAFSRDSTRLLGGSANGAEVFVFGVESGEIEQAFTEHAAPIAAMAWTGEQGDSIFSASEDGSLRTWPLLAVRRLMGHSQPVVALDAVPNAPGQIVSGSADGSIRFWNTADGQQLRQLEHGGPVTAVAVRPDGLRLASAGANNIVRLWNAQDFQQVAELKGDYRAQSRLAHLQRRLGVRKGLADAEVAAVTAAQQAATAGVDAVKAAVTVQTTAMTALAEKVTAATAATEAKAAADKLVAEATEAKRVADEAKVAADKALADSEAAKTAADAAVVAAQTALDADVNNADLAKAKQDADQRAADAATALATAQQAKTAADAAAAAAEANLKAPTDDAAAKTKAAEEAEAARVAADSAKSAADSALAASIAASARATEAVPLAKAASDNSTAKAQAAQTEVDAAAQASTALEMPLRALAFSPDNMRLAAAGDARIVHTWNATTGANCETYTAHEQAVLALAWIGDKRLAAGSADHSAIVYDTDPEWVWERTIGGETRSELIDRVTSLDFSPDGRLIASGSGDPSRSGELKIWNAADGTLVREIVDAHSDTVLGVEFSPDGDLLASCGADKFVKVFDVATGKFQRSFEGHTHHVLGVSWRADGRSLASCGADAVIKVWDYLSGEQRTTIGGFGKEVTSISFVGETPQVLTSSGDKTVRLHNVDNGQVVRAYAGGGDFMYFCANTADGKIYLGGGQDSILRFWNGETGEEIVNFPPPVAPASAPAEGQAAAQ